MKDGGIIVILFGPLFICIEYKRHSGEKHILKLLIVLEVALVIILYYMYVRYFIDIIPVKCSLEGQFNMGYGAVFAENYFIWGWVVIDKSFMSFLAKITR